MRRTLSFSVLISVMALAGCTITGPQSEPSWTDERIARDPARAAPPFVPELERPAGQSWMMASRARQLADTRDVLLDARTLLEIPQPDPLEFGRQARERATPPPPPARD